MGDDMRHLPQPSAIQLADEARELERQAGIIRSPNPI